MGALIAGVAVATLISAVSGAMGAQAQADAYNTLARATEQERAEFRKAYDESFGQGSYNSKMQELGVKAGQEYYDRLTDNEAWNRYISGEKAYVAPEKFSFTAEDLYSDPSYEFRKQQGMEALDQSNVANGLNLSGAAAREAQDYSSKLASTEYQNAYNRAFQNYTDDRNFDYNAWKAESQQYYNNLLKQLSGINNTAQRGVDANRAQAGALSAIANNNASAIQQQATAQGAAGMAETQAGTAVLDAIAKGINMGSGMYASQSGATPGSYASTPTNTTSVGGNSVSGGVNGGDFSTQFLAGYNPNVDTHYITTTDLIGNKSYMGA